MARIRYSALVESISGRHNGSAFRRGRHGHVMQTLGRQQQVPSQRQLAQRSRFSQIAALWYNLTELQRAGWKNAAHSEVRGYQLFMQCNQNLIAAGLSPLVTAPDVVLPPPILSMEAVPLPSTNLWQIVATFFPASPSATVLAMATPPMPRNSPLDPSKLRLYDSFPANSPITRQVNSRWNPYFGFNWSSGSKIYIRLQLVHHASGLASPARTTSFVT